MFEKKMRKAKKLLPMKISDCVCAGMARSGEIRDLEIDDEILRKAVSNTANLIKSMIIVK